MCVLKDGIRVCKISFLLYKCKRHRYMKGNTGEWSWGKYKEKNEDGQVQIYCTNWHVLQAALWFMAGMFGKNLNIFPYPVLIDKAKSGALLKNWNARDLCTVEMKERNDLY